MKMEDLVAGITSVGVWTGEHNRNKERKNASAIERKSWLPTIEIKKAFNPYYG